MTDNEIIKALKLCTSEHMGCEDGCPYATKKLTYSQCKLELSKNIIDLINRQKAEISELTAEVERLQKLQKPTKTSGFIIQNGKVVFYTNILNGYRHEYKDLEEVVKELNLMLQSCYKCDEVVSHYKGNLKIAKSEAYMEFVMNVLRRIGFCELPNAVVRGHINKAYEELTRNLHGTCTETTDQTATSVSLIDGHIEGEDR